MASPVEWLLFMVASMLAMYGLYKILASRQDRKRARKSEDWY